MRRADAGIAVRAAATAGAYLAAVHGFGAVYAQVGHPHPLGASAFRALQLVVGHFPDELDDVALPRSLAIARWALPLLTFWTTAMLAWRRVRNPVRLRWIARRGEHLVIAGDAGLAARVAGAERAGGRPVILWCEDGDAAWVGRLADAGVAFVANDGTAAGIEVLGLARAAALLLVGPDDTANMALAAAAMAAARDCRPAGDPLPIVACIDDADLRQSVEARHAREVDRGARLRVISLPDIAARALFLDQPLDRFQPLGAPTLLVLCLGFGPAIERYALRLLASGHYRDGRKPRIVVLDREAVQKEAVFRARRPGADALAPMLFEAAPVNQPALLPGLVEAAIVRHGWPSAILVDLGDDARSLAGGYAIDGWFAAADRPPPPIHVRTGPIDAAQLGTSLFAFGASAALADAGPLLQDRHDALARAIHESYLDGQLDQGTPIGARLSMREWDDLAETVRDDNRLVADCYQLKLRDIGARPGPASEAGFRLDPEEIEALARAEHGRWMAAKLIDGWAHGATRDDARRLHPDIVPYDALSERIKDLDRDQIRLMTRLLPLSGQTPRRVLPIRLEPGAGEMPLGDALDRLAALYPDREPLFVGRPDIAAVGALMRAEAEAGRSVQPILDAHPQAWIDALPSGERAGLQRMLRGADTIFAVPRGEVLPEQPGERAMTVGADGQVAAPWLR